MPMRWPLTQFRPESTTGQHQRGWCAHTELMMTHSIVYNDWVEYIHGWWYEPVGVCTTCVRKVSVGVYSVYSLRERRVRDKWRELMHNAHDNGCPPVFTTSDIYLTVLLKHRIVWNCRMLRQHLPNSWSTWPHSRSLTSHLFASAIDENQTPKYA